MRDSTYWTDYPDPIYYREYVEDLIKDVNDGYLDMSNEVEVENLKVALIEALGVLGVDVEVENE